MRQPKAEASSPAPELLEWLRTTTPREGRFEVELFRASDQMRDKFVYELPSGRWLELRRPYARAWLGDGKGVLEVYDQSMKIDSRVAENNPYIEQTIMPFLWVRTASLHPASIRRLERVASGDVVLEFDAPKGDPAKDASEGGPIWRVRMELDGTTGKVLSIARLDEADPLPSKLVHELSEKVSTFTRAPGEWKAVVAKIEKAGDADGFWNESTVRSKFADFRTQTKADDRARADLRRSQQPAAATTPGSVEVGGPVLPSTSTKYASPVLITGVLILVVGAFVWWKRRT